LLHADEPELHAAYEEMLRMVGWVMELVTRGLETPLRTHKSLVDYVDLGHGPDTTNSVFGGGALRGLLRGLLILEGEAPHLDRVKVARNVQSAGSTKGPQAGVEIWGGDVGARVEET
jgi:hypothetical protein